MRVLDEVDEAPLQGLRSGFTTSQEQIQTTQNQVAIVKTQFTVSVVLGTNTRSVHIKVSFWFWLRQCYDNHTFSSIRKVSM